MDYDNCQFFEDETLGKYNVSLGRPGASSSEITVNAKSRNLGNPISINCGAGGVLSANVCIYPDDADLAVISIDGEFEKVVEYGPLFFPENNVLDIKQLGNSVLPPEIYNLFSGEQSFQGYSAPDIPLFSPGTIMGGFFQNSNFNGNISNWNTTNVVDMSSMFFFALNFNQDFNWDTSNVTNMNSMFYSASEFNSNLNFSNVCKVSNIDNMFSETYAMQTNLSNLNFKISEPAYSGLYYYPVQKKPNFNSISCP